MEGYTSIIKCDLERGIVHKQLKKEFIDRCLSQEIKALRALAKQPHYISRHFPKIISHTEDSIYMEYCGEQLTKQDLPKDWELQTEEILQGLLETGIVHRDITPRNLLIKENIIMLIDFGWASGVASKDILSDDLKRLGGSWKNPKGFDDSYSLVMSLKTLDF